MRTVPSRPPIVRMLVLLAAFAAGPLVGIAVARPLGVEASLASAISPFAFAGAYLGGLLLWFGRGAIPLIRHAWRRDVTREGSDVQEVPPGYLAFVLLALFFGGFAGVFVGVFTSATIVAATGLHLAAGLAYGAGLWLLAHEGWLGFPEPE